LSGWSLASMMSDGWTRGGRVVLSRSLQIAAIAGALSYAAFFCTKRARHDRAWRWGAWLCTGAALVVAVTPSMP